MAQKPCKDCEDCKCGKPKKVTLADIMRFVRKTYPEVRLRDVVIVPGFRPGTILVYSRKDKKAPK